MTRLGTAFVEVRPDWSKFDRAVATHIPPTMQRSGEDAGSRFGKGFEERTSGLLSPLNRELDGLDRRKADVRVGPGIERLLSLGRAKIRVPDIPAPKVGAPEVPLPKLPGGLRDLDIKARLDLQIEGADAQIETLNTRIAELRDKPTTVEVKTDIARAVAELDRVEAKRRDLDGKRANLTVDVDDSAVGVFDRISASVAGLAASLSGGGGGIDGGIARVNAGFLSFNSSLGPLLAGLAALSVAVGVALVGALSALAASAAAAAAGLGALGVAIGGVLAPALALGIAGGLRLGKVFEALKAQDDAADELGRKTAAGSAAAAAAIDQQASASRALKDAQGRLREASVSAFREMADAAEAASDAVRGVESASLSLDSAKLSTREAKNELAKFREEAGATGQAFSAVFNKFTDVSVDTSGLRKALVDANKAAGGPELDTDQELKLERLILNVREARLREKEAVDGVSDAERNRARAIQRNTEFQKQGIRASEGYRAALKGVEAASLAVAAAQRQQGISTAQAKAEQLTGRLTEREQRLLEAIKKVRVELRGAFTMATDAAFGGMIRALERVPKLVNPLRGAFGRLGAAWGAAVDQFSRDLIRPETVSALRAFTDGAARLTGPVAKGLSALLAIFLNIGQAALPFLVSGTRKVSEQLQDWAKRTGDQKKLSDTIGTLVGHLKVWLGVGAAVADVFLAFFQSAAKPGKDLAEQIRQLAERTARWLRSDEGREQLKKFFHDVIPFARDLVEFMGRLVGAATRFGRATAKVLATVIEKFGGASNAADALVFAITTLTALKFTKGLVSGVGEAVTGYKALRAQAVRLHAALATQSAGARLAAGAQKALNVVMNAGVVAAVRQRVAMLASVAAMKAMRAATVVASAAMLALNVAMSLGPLGLLALAVAGLVAGFVLFGGHLDEVTAAAKKAWAVIKDGAEKVLGFVKERWPLILALLTGPVGLAVYAIVKNFDKLKGAAGKAFDAVKGAVSNAAGAVGGAVAKAARAVGNFAANAFTSGVDFVANLVAGIRSVAGKVAGAVRDAIAGALHAIRAFLGNALDRGRELLRKVRDGIANGASALAGAAKDAVVGAIDAIGNLGSRVFNAGKALGRRLLGGLKNILGDIGGVGKTVANGLIGLLNDAIPNKLGPINLPDNPLPKFRRGGLIPGMGTGDKIPILAEPREFMVRRRIVEQLGITVLADINSGRLDPRVGYELGERPSLTVAPVRGRAFANGGPILAAAATAGGGASRTINATFPITVPGGGPPDPVALAVQAARQVEDRWGGDVGQDT